MTMDHGSKRQPCPSTPLQSTQMDALWNPFHSSFMLPAKGGKRGGYQLATMISLFLPKGREALEGKS